MTAQGEASPRVQNRYCEVAIVGGGLAGSVLAREIAETKDVILIERGGREQGPVDTACEEGQVSGLDYPLGLTRDFRLGGATSIWAGYCAEFDAGDFEERPGIPLSGWPFAAGTLAPFRQQAARIMNLSGVSFDPSVLLMDARNPLPFCPKGLVATSWRFGKPVLRLLEHWNWDQIEAGGAQLMTSTRVLEVIPAADKSGVDHLICLDGHGHRFRVFADTYVLAAGGLETARLLLSSDAPNGVSNSSGMVGRAFCEHPHFTAEEFVLEPDHPIAAWAERGTDRAGHDFAFCMGVPDERRAELGILNARAHVFRTPKMDMSETPRLGLFLEQAPDRQSRVSLSSKRDADGVPLLNLEWCLSELDKRTIHETYDYVSEMLEAAGAGRRVGPLKKEDITADRIMHSNHQLGTTRMSRDPASGVVDENCRSHELDNLYIIGGSVFPTVSWANPSYTLLQLTLRLAEHLKLQH